jgi:hypothetical protein
MQCRGGGSGDAGVGGNYYWIRRADAPGTYGTLAARVGRRGPNFHRGLRLVPALLHHRLVHPLEPILSTIYYFIKRYTFSMRTLSRYPIIVMLIAALTILSGCAEQKPKPSGAQTRAGSTPQGSLLKPMTQPPVLVVPPGIPEWQRRLLTDVNDQKYELELLYQFVNQELALISAGQLRNDFPDPLDLCEYYDIQGNYAKQLALINARHRSDIYAFYGHLAQINTYLLQRQALPYQPYSNIPQRIRELDQYILSEIGVARAADFSWIK